MNIVKEYGFFLQVIIFWEININIRQTHLFLQATDLGVMSVWWGCAVGFIDAGTSYFSIQSTIETPCNTSIAGTEYIVCTMYVLLTISYQSKQRHTWNCLNTTVLSRSTIAAHRGGDITTGRRNFSWQEMLMRWKTSGDWGSRGGDLDGSWSVQAKTMCLAPNKLSLPISTDI